MGKHRGSITSIAAGVAVVIMASACGSAPERSARAFCNEFEHEAVRLHGKYQQQADTIGATDDAFTKAFGALGMGLEAQGDMVTLFDRLEQRAPSDIQPDVAAVRDSFKAQRDAMRDAVGNPFGALGKGLIGALQAQGSYQRVDRYISDHCDLSFMRQGAGS